MATRTGGERWLVPAAGIGLALAARAWLRQRQAIDLRGQVALITGGSRGLGFTLAQELAGEGAKLAICARDPEPLERARQDLVALGAEVLAVHCDVGRRDEVEALVRQVTERFGRVDVLLNVAGIISVGPEEAQRLEDYQQAMDAMYWGVVYTTLAVLPQMRARGSGRIVNVTSIGGKVAVPHLLPYSAAKFAAVGFSEGLRTEVARHGIAVTTVVPGLMRTGSHLNAQFKGQHGLEYTLFSLVGNLPFTSMSARDAARMIVSALRHGDPEVVLGWQAGLLMRLHGVAPGLTQDLLALVDRALPGPGDAPDAARRRLGRESQTPLSESFLTGLGQRAARDLNQGPTR
jgi:NAD(P)-dependent dehydrogenase (short-subunit alcohol dehydrogenase family)